MIFWIPPGYSYRSVIDLTYWVSPEMCSERDSPLEPFVLPAPGQPELARLTCGAHLGPPVLTRKQKRPRVNSLVCDRAAAFCAAGPPEALSWMSRLVTQAAKRERELARAHSQRLKQATLSLPGQSVSRGFADRGALEGYPSHYTSLVSHNVFSFVWCVFIYPIPRSSKLWGGVGMAEDWLPVNRWRPNGLRTHGRNRGQLEFRSQVVPKTYHFKMAPTEFRSLLTKWPFWLNLWNDQWSISLHEDKEL